MGAKSSRLLVEFPILRVSLELPSTEHQPVQKATLDTLTIVSPVGDTPFDRVKNGLADLESYTRRLIHAMQETRDSLASSQ